MLARLIVLVTIVLAAAALGAGQLSGGERLREAPALTRVTAGTLAAGDPVPQPRGKPVLRLRGAANRNDGGATAMDLATLERLPQVRLTVHEPFRKRTMTFQGVRLRFSMAELAGSDAVLATRADGRRIPVAEGGPLRVVFPAGTELGRNTDNWIWSVDWIRTL